MGDTPNFVFKRMLFAEFTQAMLPSVQGFAISSDGYFSDIFFLNKTHLLSF